MKVIDYDKYIDMIHSTKYDNILNELKSDVVDYIMNVLKMTDRTPDYFQMTLDKTINSPALASFSFSITNKDNYSTPHEKLLTVNKQFLVNCGILGRKDILLDTIKHELVHFYVSQTVSPKDAMDGEFAFEMALKKYGAPSSCATPKEKRFTNTVDVPLCKTYYATDVGDVVVILNIGAKSLNNVTLNGKFYKYMEAQKITVEI